MPMPTPSIFDELRVQHASSRATQDRHADVEGYEAIDKRMRHAYQWRPRPARRTARRAGRIAR